MNAIELADKLESYTRINDEIGRVVVGQTDVMIEAARLLREQREALGAVLNTLDLLVNRHYGGDLEPDEVDGGQAEIDALIAARQAYKAKP